MFIEMEAPPRSDLAPYLTPRYIQTPCVEILLDRSCMIFEPHRKFLISNHCRCVWHLPPSLPPSLPGWKTPRIRRLKSSEGVRSAESCQTVLHYR